MCLIIDHAEIIKKPLTVYVVRKIYDGCIENIYSPYYYSKWEVGVNKDYNNDGKSTVNDFGEGFEVHGDYFHSLKTLESAQIMAKQLNEYRNFHDNHEYIVFEAEITPSLIIHGVFEFGDCYDFDSIYSSNLTLIKQITGE